MYITVKTVTPTALLVYCTNDTLLWITHSIQKWEFNLTGSSDQNKIQRVVKCVPKLKIDLRAVKIE